MEKINNNTDHGSSTTPKIDTTTVSEASTTAAATEANTTTRTEAIVDITRSKTGLPCLWESGGGWSNTGSAQIITDGQGNPKRAIHVRTHGDLACREHALIPIREGDHVVTVNRHWDRVSIRVERIDSIQEDTATLAPETVPICVDAINAAIAKANDYHCRSAYYIKNNEEDNTND